MNMPQHDKKTTSFSQFLLEVRTLPIIPRVFLKHGFLERNGSSKQNTCFATGALGGDLANVWIWKYLGVQGKLRNITHIGAPFAQLHTDRVGRLTPLYSRNGSVNPSSPVYVQLSLGGCSICQNKIQGNIGEKNASLLVKGGSPQKQIQPKPRFLSNLFLQLTSPTLYVWPRMKTLCGAHLHPSLSLLPCPPKHNIKKGNSFSSNA